VIEYHVSQDLKAAADSIADALLRRLNELANQQQVVHLAVTGGTLGIALLAAAAAHPSLHSVPWSRVNIWWGDERFVAADSPDRNDGQAINALFHLLPEAKLHRMPAETADQNLDDATEIFSEEVSNFSVQGFIPFDITLLGMGPDGHVASLFPGKTLPAPGRLVIAEPDSPKLPPQRISFSYESLNASREVWFVVAGADKAEAVAIANSSSFNQVPAGRVHGKEKTVWFLDQAAAAELNLKD
jgi:6-phosphogluconolactonase